MAGGLVVKTVGVMHNYITARQTEWENETELQ